MLLVSAIAVFLFSCLILYVFIDEHKSKKIEKEHASAEVKQRSFVEQSIEHERELKVGSSTDQGSEEGAMGIFKQAIYATLIMGVIQAIMRSQSNPAGAASVAILCIVLAGLLTGIYWMIKGVKGVSK
jgi:uncharacterized membrane protein